MNAIRAGVALAAVMALTACGGGGRLSHSEFVRDASRICREASSKARHVALPSLLTASDTASALESIRDREQKVIARLRDLDPPKDDASNVSKWLAVLDQMVSEVDFARDAVGRGTAGTAIEALARADTLERRGRMLAHEQGIAACQFTHLPNAA